VPDVRRVDRTLIYLKPDILLMLDRVTLASALPVQLRYQVYNDDTKGAATASSSGFQITRPSAHLDARLHSDGEFTCSVLKHDLPESEGVHPFVEVVSAAATTHTLLTVATARPANTPRDPGSPSIVRQGRAWRVGGIHRGKTFDVTIDPSGALPVITIS
jgi:hypothetical protein